SKAAACAVGAALMIPFCCGQGSLLSYGVYIGIEHAKNNPGKQRSFFYQDDPELLKKILIPTLIVNAIVFLVAPGMAVPAALLGIKPRSPEERPNYGYTPPPPDPGYRPGDQGIRPGPGNWPGGS